MKRSSSVLVVLGWVLLVITCTWAEAQSGSWESDPTSLAVNSQPAAPVPVDSGLPDLLTGAGRSDARAIQEAIDKFKVLFEREDADQLKNGIWPSMSARQYRAVRDTFKTVSQVTLRETCLGLPAIAGDSAEWTCQEMLGYYVSGKPRPWQVNTIQFHLKKLDGRWYVEGRRGK